MTTHGQPAVAQNDNSTSAGPAESGPNTVATAAQTPTATEPAEPMPAAQAAPAAAPSNPDGEPTAHLAPDAEPTAQDTPATHPEPDATPTAQDTPKAAPAAKLADSRDREGKPVPAARKPVAIMSEAGEDNPSSTATDSEAKATIEPTPAQADGVKPGAGAERAAQPEPAARAKPPTQAKPPTRAEPEPKLAAETRPNTEVEPAESQGTETPLIEPVTSEPVTTEPVTTGPVVDAGLKPGAETEPDSETLPGTHDRAGRVLPEAEPSTTAEIEAGPGPEAHGADQRDPALDVLAVPGQIGDLALTLRRLRTELVSSTYPLAMPSAEEARRMSAAVVAQIDDYLLPRLARLDAPLLVVVGGSTGAGKSTLVNSLVRARVSPAGVLRPTTRAPVLVSHPVDTAWFRQGRLLPGLTRTTRAGDDPHTLRLVAAPALTPGLALLDAPDIDSVVSTNRQLAGQLLSAADLWLFVTTAARYADAVPWDMLQTAEYRGTVVALVLDRVPADAAAEVIPHLTDLLGAHRFNGVPLFVLPETTLDGQGLLAEDVVEPIAAWLAGLAADATARSAVIRQTVDGALATIEPIVAGLAEAAEDQVSATMSLTDRAGAAYRTARLRVERAMQDGTLLRGEVLARWQEFVGTGELARALEARNDRVRDQVVAAVTGRSTPGKPLRTALESGLVALVRAAAADGAEQAYAGWQAHPSGAALLHPDLARPSADLAQRAERLVRDWQQGVSHLVGGAAHDGSAIARGTAYAVNATTVLVMAGIFTSAALGDQTIRTLAQKARDDLLARVDALLDAEAGRFLRLLPTYGLGVPAADRLRGAGEQVERARRGARLTAGAGPVELALPAAARASEEEG